MGAGNKGPRGARVVALPDRAFEVDPYVRAVQSADHGRRLVAHMLAMLNAAVPSRSLALHPLDRDGSSNGAGIVLRNGDVPIPPEQTRREYLRGYHVDDPLHPREHADSGVKLLTTRDVGGRPELRRTGFGEYLDAHRYAHMLRMYLREEGQLVGHVFIARTADEGDFRESELAFLRRAHPFVEHSYVAARALSSPSAGDDVLADTALTEREREVARLAARGLRSREIANLLVLSEATVKTHLAHIFAKLGVRTRTELAALLRSAA